MHNGVKSVGNRTVAPARERGLKFRDPVGGVAVNRRSREGAWIEILFLYIYLYLCTLSLPRGSVD